MDKFIQWSTELDTDITIIDEEHKFLVDNINILHKLMNQKGVPQAATDSAMKDILNNLAHYTHTHFVVEEEFMRVYSYPDRDAHKAEHDDFISKVSGLNADFQENSLDLSNSLLLFLKDWLTNHILKTDHKMTAFLKDKGQN